MDVQIIIVEVPRRGHQVLSGHLPNSEDPVQYSVVCCLYWNRWDSKPKYIDHLISVDVTRNLSCDTASMGKGLQGHWIYWLVAIPNMCVSGARITPAWEAFVQHFELASRSMLCQVIYDEPRGGEVGSADRDHISAFDYGEDLVVKELFVWLEASNSLGVSEWVNGEVEISEIESQIPAASAFVRASKASTADITTSSSWLSNSPAVWWHVYAEQGGSVKNHELFSASELGRAEGGICNLHPDVPFSPSATHAWIGNWNTVEENAYSDQIDFIAAAPWPAPSGENVPNFDSSIILL